MSVYFPRSGYADHHVEKAYKAIEKHTKSKKFIQIVGGDFNAELGPGIGIERISVGLHSQRSKQLSEGNQEAVHSQHNVQKNTRKQATHMTPKGDMKQLDYIRVDRKHLWCCGDAEAIDMIHMGSDHRSVMATFVFIALN